MQAAIPTKLLEVSRVKLQWACQFDTFDRVTLPKNVTEQRIHAWVRRPLLGPTDSQQGAAKAWNFFSQ
jgi:hypothetical protein